MNRADLERKREVMARAGLDLDGRRIAGTTRRRLFEKEAEAAEKAIPANSEHAALLAHCKPETYKPEPLSQSERRTMEDRLALAADVLNTPGVRNNPVHLKRWTRIARECREKLG